MTAAGRVRPPARTAPGPESHPRRAFRRTAYVLAVTAFAAAVPTPLYPVYAAQLHFSPAVLGLVFAAYAPGVLVTLIFLAPRAEHLGRNRLLALGMGLVVAASVVFALASNVGALALARVVSGLAVGTTTSVATAAMSDLEPDGDQHHVARVAVAANFGGVAVGVLGSGLLAQLAPSPLQLVYLLPVVAAVIGAVAIRTIPETATDLGTGTPWRAPAVRVPPGIRRTFWVAVGGIVACYAIYGLFGALVPSYVRIGLGIPSPAVAAAIVALMFGSAAATQLLTAQTRDRRALLLGFPGLLVSLVALVLLLRAEAIAPLLLVVAALGVSVGLTFMGSVTLVDRIALDAQRGGVFAGFYTAGYLALAIPTLAIAAASESIGLGTAAAVFGSLLAVVVAALYVETYRTPTPAGGGGRPGMRRS
ncbi:MAG: MFS transporter [Thermoplasmata archaeon]|nr:MFS transporter [Thermoplasmata archaeon]MCI4355968.1 MFS transporter [Thermoplasmata archaeon]